jgi:hypothetical protein
MQQPEEYRLEFLYGQEAPPEDEVLRGMQNLEEEEKGRFDRQRRNEREKGDHEKKVRRPLLDVVGKDNQAKEGVQRLQEMDANAGQQRREVEAEAPEVPMEVQRIFTGSIGATVGLPYNYGWTWNATSGNPALSVSANKTTGKMGFGIWNNSNDASGTARAGLGIFFRPMTANGILRLSANPAYTYSWWTYCAFASAHSDAYIGLYVGRYTLSGGFDGAPVSQQLVLWSDDSWWSGAGSHTGSSAGHPLFAQFNVDSSHYYALWVWCGGRATGAGWGTFSGSGAASNLSITVPSITWELF